MDIALKAGVIMLTAGAEIYRVEETIARICSSYRVRSECFVLPTGVFISFTGENDQNPHTAFKRIKQRTVNLNRIELVNTFSRGLQYNPLNYEEALEALKDIEIRRTYGFSPRLASACITAFVFTLLFGGEYREGIAAAIVAFFVYSLRELLASVGIIQFFELFISGLVSGALSLFTVFIFSGFNLYKIIIGSIMIFLPGVAITNSIKDALYGDWVASVSRMAEAVFIAVAVGAGVGIALSAGFNWR